MKIAFTQTARSDLDTIATFLLSHNPFASENVATDILAAIERLGDYPFSGRRQDEADVRKLVSPRYRYRIFYLVEEDRAVVTILSILHPSRQG